MKSVKTYKSPILSSYSYDGQRVDLEQLLNCPFEDIREAAERIPALIGWFGHQKGMATERLLSADYTASETEARAYFDLKGGKFVSQGFGEKMTEESLKRAVILMPEVKAAHDLYNKRKGVSEHISWIIRALEAKLELVRSSEATRRMEHEPDKNRSRTE